MDAQIKASFETLAGSPWIDAAPIEDLARLFIRVTRREGVLPPNRRGRHPSRLMLEGPLSDYSGAELRVAARLARHLTAAGDLLDDRCSGPFAHLRRMNGALYASRMTWLGAGRRCGSVEEAAGVLLGGIEPDEAVLGPALAAFDEEHGHPAAPAPGP